MSVPLQMSPSPSDTQAAHGSVDATQPRTGCGSDGALLPMRLACAYDRLRLSIYKRRGTRGHRIQIDRIGASTLLRFDDVGYFNTVYSQGPDVAQHLEIGRAHV